MADSLDQLHVARMATWEDTPVVILEKLAQTRQPQHADIPISCQFTAPP